MRVAAVRPFDGLSVTKRQFEGDKWHASIPEAVAALSP